MTVDDYLSYNLITDLYQYYIDFQKFMSLSIHYKVIKFKVKEDQK